MARTCEKFNLFSLSLTFGGFHVSDNGDASDDIALYERNPIDNTNNSTLNFDKKNDDTYRYNIADMFEAEDYQVWIAHLETSPSRTPHLEENGEYLRDQIEYVASQNPWPITIVAHSMGGLVSWSHTSRARPWRYKSTQFYTMGSPHTGIPTEILTYGITPYPGSDDYLSILCIVQPAGCDMQPTKMPNFNKK